MSYTVKELLNEENDKDGKQLEKHMNLFHHIVSKGRDEWDGNAISEDDDDVHEGLEHHASTVPDHLKLKLHKKIINTMKNDNINSKSSRDGDGSDNAAYTKGAIERISKIYS